MGRGGEGDCGEVERRGGGGQGREGEHGGEEVGRLEEMSGYLVLLSLVRVVGR